MPRPRPTVGSTTGLTGTSGTSGGSPTISGGPVPAGSIIPASLKTTPTSPTGAGQVLGYDGTGFAWVAPGGSSAAVLTNRGVWAVSTSYAVGDVVVNGSTTYACTTSHTSGVTFSGTNWVALGSTAGGLASITITGTPSAGQVLQATSSTAATWVTPTSPQSTLGTIQTAASTPVTGRVNRYDASSGALSLTMPAVAAAGGSFSVQKTDSSTNTVTIGGVTLDKPKALVEFVSDGTVWAQVNASTGSPQTPDGGSGLGSVTVSGTPTAGQVLTASSGTAASWSTPASGAGDATTAAKGVVQLAGDLGGTASAPTVPGLAGKYTKPGPGIPATDLTAAVQSAVAAAGTAVQSVNGKTGTSVTLNASDVGAVASVVGQTGAVTGAQIAADPALTGTYVPVGLAKWRTKLRTDASNAKVVFCGDSTSDAATAAGLMYRRLQALHAQPGEALYGVGASDYYTDGVGNGTTTFTSATANFTSADVGRFVHGKGTPLSTTIVSVTNSTTVILGATVPSGTSLPFWVDRHIINGGNNGVLLTDWFASPAGAYPYNRNRLAAENPDLTVYSWLFNDIRQGAMGTTVAACVASGIAKMQALITWHRANVTGSILLRMPNPMLTANVGSLNFVSDGTTINAAGIAQIYSTALRQIYLYFVDRYPDVEVIDIQGEVFGTVCTSSHPLMADQLHPSVNVSADINLIVPTGGGYVAIADAIAARIGFPRNAFAVDGAHRIKHDFIVYDAPSANTLRLISRDAYGLPAPQAPVFNADSLYIQGADSPISLAAATIDRVFSSTVLQITGLTGDWSPYIGRSAIVAGSHAGASTGDRQQIYVDLASVAAGATVVQTVSVAGSVTGNAGSGTAVIPSPGASFGGSGLLLLGCYCSVSGTVKLVIQNPTGAAIDVVGESWTFWVVR